MKHTKGGMAPLLDADKKFLEIYLSNGKVAWRAYKESHPKLNRTDAKWSQLCTAYMKRPKMVKALAEIEKKAMVHVEKAVGRYGITKEKIALELARIGFANPTDVMSFGPDGVTIKDSSQLSEDEKASIAEVKETRGKEGEITVNVKQYDKVQALTALGKHMGMFTEQVDHTHRIAAKLIIES